MREAEQSELEVGLGFRVEDSVPGFGISGGFRPCTLNPLRV